MFPVCSQAFLLSQICMWVDNAAAADFFLDGTVTIFEGIFVITVIAPTPDGMISPKVLTSQVLSVCHGQNTGQTQTSLPYCVVLCCVCVI